MSYIFQIGVQCTLGFGIIVGCFDLLNIRLINSLRLRCGDHEIGTKIQTKTTKYNYYFKNITTYFIKIRNQNGAYKCNRDKSNK